MSDVARICVGALVGRSVSDPLAWGLDFAMPATFLTMLLPQIVSPRLVAVVTVAAVVSVTAYVILPGTWYIILATVAAVVTGMALETHESQRAKT